MSHAADFQRLSPTTLADVLGRDRVMDTGIRPLWSGMPRVAGPAYPVRCAPGDNLMLHAAIHRAPAGSIIVVEAGDVDYAVAGGNVCAVAQKNGIIAFVIDGVIRDLAEIRERQFPVFARGIMPFPGGKDVLDVLNGTVRCGGVQVSPGDMIVADEEGIVAVAVPTIGTILASAQARAARDAELTLDQWEAAHRARIDEILRKKGFTGGQ
jgi:4-hydroxy-4-methyl-2-oxoglutarate aldolase